MFGNGKYLLDTLTINGPISCSLLEKGIATGKRKKPRKNGMSHEEGRKAFLLSTAPC